MRKCGDGIIGQSPAAWSSGRGLRRDAVQPAEHDQPIPERLQRLQDCRELERSAFDGRRPVPIPHINPVGNVDRAETLHGLGRRGEGGRHAVEQRQSERRTDAAQHCAAGNRLLRDETWKECRIF